MILNRSIHYLTATSMLWMIQMTEDQCRHVYSALIVAQLARYKMTHRLPEHDKSSVI